MKTTFLKRLTSRRELDVQLTADGEAVLGDARRGGVVVR